MKRTFPIMLAGLNKVVRKPSKHVIICSMAFRHVVFYLVHTVDFHSLYFHQTFSLYTWLPMTGLTI